MRRLQAQTLPDEAPPVGKIHPCSKTEKIIQNAKISDTPFNQRSLIHREVWLPGGPRIPKNPVFFKSGKNHQKRENSKMYRVWQN